MHDFGLSPSGGNFDESNQVLQNRKCFALCGSRWKHVWALELLARCSTDATCTFSDRSRRLFLRSSRSRLPGVLVYVCFVCCISCLAFGDSGSKNAPGNWRHRVDSLRVFTSRTLCKLDIFLRVCAASCSANCCLHWLGDWPGGGKSEGSAEPD